MNCYSAQCYGIFLTSLNLTCTKVKNTPQPWVDSAHQRTLQETLHTPIGIWGKDPGITSPYAKTQDCSIFSTPRLTIIVSERPSGKNRITQELVPRFVSQINLLVLIWHKPKPEVIWKHTLVWKYEDIPKTPQYSKTPLYPDHYQVQTKFSIEDDNDTEELPQTKAWRSVWKHPQSCTMYKLAHRFVRQVNVLVSTRCGSLPKGASGQTSISSLFPHY